MSPAFRASGLRSMQASSASSRSYYNIDGSLWKGNTLREGESLIVELKVESAGACPMRWWWTCCRRAWKSKTST